MMLRPAVPHDGPMMAEIWHAGWRDGHLGFVPSELVAARDEASFHRRAPQRLDDTTVAVVEGEVAGFVMVVGDEVEQVYVAASHRGAGVADALMSEAERQVRAAATLVPGSRSWRATRALDGSTSVAAGGTRVPSITPRPATTDRSRCPPIGM